MRKEKAKHNKGTFLVLVGTTFGGKQKMDGLHDKIRRWCFFVAKLIVQNECRVYTCERFSCAVLA